MDELLDVILPNLKAQGDLIGIFPTPNNQGVTPPIDMVIDDLRTELGKIEDRRSRRDNPRFY